MLPNFGYYKLRIILLVFKFVYDARHKKLNVICIKLAHSVEMIVKFMYKI
jgi:hypothetical protein